MSDSARFFCFRDERYYSALPPGRMALNDPDGLLAAGGNLDTATLMHAYRHGIFPWYSAGQPLLWWAPDPRTVFFPSQFHISRSLARTFRRRQFAVTLDQDFAAVMLACGPERTDERDTWITPAMLRAYTQLHAEGHAHSVECWRHNELVGGVYGVALGRVFFGESMFSRATDASKLALATLCHMLAIWGFELFDCQMESAHLNSLGATQVSRERFGRLLDEFATRSPSAVAWREPLEMPIQ